MDRFITGLVSLQVKEKLRLPPRPSNFRDAVNSAMAYTAAIFPEHQTLRQKSFIWKMAASCSHPLLTKPIHNSQMGSIQMVEESPEGDASIQAVRQWRSLHKTDRHSDSECRVQQETVASSTKAPKKRSTGVKRIASLTGLNLSLRQAKRNFSVPSKKQKGFSLKVAIQTTTES